MTSSSAEYTRAELWSARPAGERTIIGNWKAGCRTASESVDLSRSVTAALSPVPAGVRVVVCPAFTALGAVRPLLGDGILLGAQDLFWEDQGAYTGAITGPMLTDLGCVCALVGHSERRRLFGETDDVVARKLRACWRHGLMPVLCVGESLAQREAGATASVLQAQVRSGLSGCAPGPLAIAYEPIWAIGTGRAATPRDCADGLAVIRACVAEIWPSLSPVPCLYGGSVTTENCAGFWGAGTADGALVGGVSLKAGEFATICRIAADGGRADA